MNNTNNNSVQRDTVLLQPQDLPPLPPMGAIGPDVCAIIRIYLAVSDDLTPTQRQILYQHVEFCHWCKNEQQLIGRATQLMHYVHGSEPSAHVDHAVMAAIAARHDQRMHLAPPMTMASRRRRQPALRLMGALVAAALVILAIWFSVSPLLPQPQQTFTLPTDLSWNSDVLYYKQTMTNAQGERYQVTCYHNRSDNTINLETVMNGKVDIVVVKDQQKSLGLDKMSHIAQWDVRYWSENEPFFNLERLRQDLRDGKVVYAGKDQFKGQEVYRIRYPDGHVLLLDMDYMPVNILPQGDKTTDAVAPMYDTVQWLHPSQVAASMWDMQVPPDFRMGEIAPRP